MKYNSINYSSIWNYSKQSTIESTSLLSQTGWSQLIINNKILVSITETKIIMLNKLQSAKVIAKNASIHLLNIPFHLSTSTVSIWIHSISNWHTKTSSSKTSPKITKPQYWKTPFSTPTPPIHSSTKIKKIQFQ